MGKSSVEERDGSIMAISRSSRLHNAQKFMDIELIIRVSTRARSMYIRLFAALNLN